ncbi:UbiA family prenyltransferase [Desulfopila aestuarii]|nr:UbiA family prenyltransferase [Desulfopila aestuarii]
MNQTKNDEVTEGDVASASTIWASVVAAWQLAKVPLCFLIGCSTSFGAALVSNSSLLSILILGLGVLMVAMSGATVNSLQERDIDRQFKRTASRPLVRKTVSGTFAILQSVILFTFGLLLLGTTDAAPKIVVSLVILSLLIYNCLYTQLKQKTVMAIIPGAICGALPPVIGWVGGGGALFSYVALLLFVMLFLWQVPHFCLVLLLHKEDYLKVEQPNFIRMFAERGVRHLSTVWICGLALVMMLFALSTAAISIWQIFLVIVNALVLAGVSSYLLLSQLPVSYRNLFIFLNIMLGNHMLIMAVPHLIF